MNCGQCGRPVNTAGHCPSCTFDRTGADVQPSPHDVFNIAVKTAVKLDAIETRLARLEKENAMKFTVKCAICGNHYFKDESAACPHKTPLDADRHVLRGASVVTVENAARIDAMEQRLARVERELATQDRVLTELRRELALHRPQYDATKPLPGTVAEHTERA